MIVWVDLDGVLANFEKEVEFLVGSNWKEEIDSPNWGKIAEFQDIYLNLPRMDDAYDLWEFLTANFHNVQILTAIPRRAYFPDAVNHKREWVHKHFGPDVKVNFGPYAQDKQYHCRPGDLLIDDMKINCDQWRDRKGWSVCHTSAGDTINEIRRGLDDIVRL